MDKLQAMEVFVRVVDTGSFTRAADSLQMPKATVSKLIHSLEVTLAAKLLNRTTRQVSVTADGAAYYERCLGILAEVRDAEDSLSKTRVSPSGRSASGGTERYCSSRSRTSEDPLLTDRTTS